MSETLIFSLIFGFVGFILVGLALFFWLRTRAFLGTAQKAQGTVIRMVYSSDSDGGGGYSPVYTFRTMSGQVIEVTDNISSNPPQFKEGQMIDVLYDPENPGRARINKWFNLYFVPLLLGFLGLVFGGIGIGMLVALAFGFFK
jgi:hypothetical protein